MGTLRIRKISIYIALALLSYFIFFWLERAARRMPQFMLPQWQIRYFVNHMKKAELVPDTEIGFLIAPNQRGEIQTPDFTFLSVTDSKGFPNRDPWPAKADIVFLGDSLIVGQGVGLADSFPQVIAKMLPNQTIINLGIAAAGPERQYPIFRRFGAGLKPNLVVSCLYLAADFDNDSGFRSWLSQGKHSDYNDYRLRLAKDRRSPTRLDRLFERSWLLGMARELVTDWVAGDNRLPDRHRFPDGKEILLNRPTVEFAAEVASAQDERIEAMLQSVEKLRDLVERHNAKLLVMLIPSKEELFGVNDSMRNQNVVSRMRQRLEETKLAVLDLYPAILKGGAIGSPYFSRDIHLNEFGNRIVAKQFLAWFHNQASNAPSMN